MLFDGDALYKVLTTSLAYARELCPEYRRHMGSLGSIRREHVHASVRGDVHVDHRSCTIQHAALLRMANDITSARVSASRAGRHPDPTGGSSSRGGERRWVR